MAVIDIDRHILSQIVMLQVDIKKLSARYEIEWQKIIEVRDKTDALFSFPQKGNEEDFKALRNKIFRATRNAQIIANQIAGKIYQQEALLFHIVSEIKEVDTHKGRETL